MVLGTVAALRFEQAVPLPREEREAYSLATLGILSALTAAILGTLAVALGGRAMADAFHEPELLDLLWFVPVISSVVGMFLVLNQLALRQRRYGSVGRRNLLQTVATVCTQLVAGALNLRPGGLVLGLGCGQALGALSLLHGAGLGREDARNGRRVAYMWRTGLLYRRFPLLLAPSSLLNVAGFQVPVLLIAHYYGSQVAGWLGLTQQVLALPVTLIGNAVGQVYLGEVSRSARTSSKRVGELFLATTRRLGLVSLVIALLLLTLGPWAFSLVFGAPWLESGSYAQALSVSLAVQLVAAPVSQTLIVFHKQAIQLAWDSGRFIIAIGAVVGCWALGGTALEAIWALSIASALAYIISWLLSAHTIRTHLRQAPTRGEE